MGLKSRRMKVAEMGALRVSALEIANKVRNQLGKPPVDHLYGGIRSDKDRCAITETVYNDDEDLRANFKVETTWDNVNVYPRGNILGQPVVREGMTANTKRFIKRFDDGRYPDLG